MGLSQILLLIAIAMMALGRPDTNVVFVSSVALVIAFLSATQDIAVDAYRVDVLSEPEMGAGVGATVLGYRLAMIWAFGGALFLADHISWPSVYLIMSASMVVGLTATAWCPEPRGQATAPTSLTEAVIEPFVEFFSRLGTRRAGLILAFIAIYKLGDNVAGNMTTRFLQETGFTLSSIGGVQGVMGVIATILGVLAGGALLSRMGILNSLWVFGFLQAGSNFAYLLLAEVGQSYPLMVFAINVEYFTQGLGTAALVAFFMSLCNRRYSATQYALLSSFMALNRDVLAAPAGYLVDWTGWPAFFLVTVFLALPGLALLWSLRNEVEVLGNGNTDRQ